MWLLTIYTLLVRYHIKQTYHYRGEIYGNLDGKYRKKYRCVTHNICNLRYKTSKEIPIILHNG